MATQIQLTRSGTPGAQPTATEMELGELALNYADGKLYFKNDSNNIEQLNSTYNNSGQTIYVNDIDDHVGLNTTSPEFLLDLGGDIGSTVNTLRINRGEAGGAAIRIGGGSGGSTSSDTTLLRVDDGDGSSVSASNGFSIDYLGSNGVGTAQIGLAIIADNQTGTPVTALMILQDGNVGIGETTVSGPVEKLHVGGTARTDQLLIGDEWDTGNPDGGQKLYIKDLAAHSQYDPFGSGSDVDSNDNYSLDKSRFPLIISVDDDETDGPNSHGIVLYNANGGQGTFSPSILFASRESDGTDYRSAAASIYSRSPLGTGGATGGSNYTDGELIFATSGTLNGSTSNSQGVTQRMVIDRAGKVGINTTTPTEVLDVNGNITASGNITATDITATDITATDITASGNAIAATPTEDTHLTTKAYVDGRITAEEYRPGELIEGFSALCNGRSVTITSGTYTIPAQEGGHTVDTAPLSGANEFTLYNGAVETGQRTNNPADADKTDDLRASIIKYKLPAGAKRVCYEFHLEQARDDTNTIIEYSTFIGDGAGTDSKNANLSSSPGDETYTRLVGQAFTSPYAVDGGHIVATINLEIVDDVNDENVSSGIIFRGNWPAGGRTLVVNADSYSSGHDALLYASTHQDGAHDAYFVRPFMKISTYA